MSTKILRIVTRFKQRSNSKRIHSKVCLKRSARADVAHSPVHRVVKAALGLRMPQSGVS